MDKKKQRIVSIVIGLILATLLVYIGIRILQKRASRADVPDSFTVERIDVDTCRITAKTQTDEPQLLRYGTQTPTFYFRMEETNITPNADGTYSQVADVNNVGADTVTFIVENHEDVSTTCDPYTGGAGGNDTTAVDPLQGIQDPVTQPTAVPVVDEPVVPTPEEEEEAVVAKASLDADTAAAYFESNDTEDFTGCFNEFKDDFYGVVQACNQAWRDASN